MFYYFVQGFRVVITGTDSKGHPFRRCDPVVVTRSQVILTVNMDSSGRFTVKPGEVLKVNITVINRSPSIDTYNLNVSDTESFYDSIDPET